MQNFHGTPFKNPTDNGHSFRGLDLEHVGHPRELSPIYIITLTISLAITTIRNFSNTLRLPYVLLMVQISFLFAQCLLSVKQTFRTAQIICVYHRSDAIKRNLYSCRRVTTSLPCTSFCHCFYGSTNWHQVCVYVAPICT